jgi:hypothetical protein
MRCCDCEFRKECKEVEPDTVSFKLCGIRIEKRIKGERGMSNYEQTIVNFEAKRKEVGEWFLKSYYSLY